MKTSVLLSEDCIKIGDELCCISKDANIIYTINLIDKNVNLLGCIPEENIYAQRLGAKIVCWNDKLIFIPLNAEKIWIWNLKSKEWINFELKKYKSNSGNLKMFQGIVFNDKLYMIGHNYPAIICLDLINNNISYIEEPFDRLHEKKRYLKDCYFICEYVQKDQYIYIASSVENLVLKFDLDSNNFWWIEVGDEKNRYSGIAWDGENFWLAPRENTPIIKWNGKEEVTEYPLPDLFEKPKKYFLGIIFDGKQLILPGMGQPNTIIINNSNACNMEIVHGQYVCYKRINEDLIVSQRIDGEVNVINRNGEIIKCSSRIDTKQLIDFLEDKIKNGVQGVSDTIIKESKLIDLDIFCTVSARTKKDVKIQSDVGKRIWETV